jgi:cysteinyl-tRNA synthetase
MANPGTKSGGGLRLYNTLTRTKEDFVPIDPANVRMYVCGPTVYDFAHIGNARPAIVFDVLFRLLRHIYGADHVTYVRNITDVDDKINARALRDFGGEIAVGKLSLNAAIRKVTETTANQYQKDVTALGCLEPTHQPRATEFVLPEAGKKSDMVTLIQKLLDKGHAYPASGKDGREILFDTASMPDYGQLSKRNLDEQQAGARVEVEAHKKNPADFVLWKESAADEPGWAGHFHAGGAHLDIRGRPGWHIECSAMSEAYLGQEFDIHGGGLDLIFPHHENEIAQSRCAHGTDVMARTWMHNGFLQVEGQKMSKSLGNFFTIAELLETDRFGGRTWPGEVLRLAMLMTHYRQPIDFTVDKLIEAEKTLASWARVWQSGMEGAPMPEGAAAALSDDLSTSELLAWLHRTYRSVEPAGNFDSRAARDLTAALQALGFNDLFNRMKGFGTTPAETHAIDEAVKTRLAFIRDKNWKEADRIRDELLAQGIQLKDGKDPLTGERVTTWEVKR